MNDLYKDLLFCGHCGAPLVKFSLPGHEDSTMYFCDSDHEELYQEDEDEAECEADGQVVIPLSQLNQLVTEALESFRDAAEMAMEDCSEQKTELEIEMAANELTLNRLHFELEHLSDPVLLNHLSPDPAVRKRKISTCRKTCLEGAELQKLLRDDRTSLEDVIRRLTEVVLLLQDPIPTQEQMSALVSMIEVYHGQVRVLMKPEVLALLGI